MVVYGQNVNAGTTNMEGALKLSKFLKNKNKEFKIAYFGSHVQAVLGKCKKENSVDIVFTNEGVYALKNLLKLNIFDSQNLLKLKDWFRDNLKIILDPTEKLVPNELMDKDLLDMLGI